jgi:metallo-beta-lactamase family protein
MVELEFFGAAQTVTGSMHLLHLPDGVVSVDAGMFQGKREWSRTMNQKLPINPRDLKALLMSHAHIDHSGRAPYLVSKGYGGPIYATGATCDLLKIMLADSAHIQEEDARFWNEKRARTPKEEIRPLYTLEDVHATTRFLYETQYNQWYPFADRCQVRFIEAGHILGSSCVHVEINTEDDPIRILFTGDLGRFNLPILRDPTSPLPEVDYLVTESTYANRRHDNPTEMKQRLVDIINETVAQGGKVIIPSFSVGRTQHLTYFLSQAIGDGSLKPLPIFVDSPLSVKATEVFQKHPECYDANARDFWRSEGDLFGRGYIRYIDQVSDSKGLNKIDEPCVIISASGMCEAGRILHHLKNNIEDERNTVLIVGFQAAQTLGRRIVDRQPELRIFGRIYRLMARVEVLNGFSAHADVTDFQKLLAPIAPKLKGAFAVHGEGEQVSAMADLLRDAGCPNVHIPKAGDKFKLT